jgi:hypothetical protein
MEAARVAAGNSCEEAKGLKNFDTGILSPDPDRYSVINGRTEHLQFKICELFTFTALKAFLVGTLSPSMQQNCLLL